MSNKSLNNLCIINTRPQHQSQPLTQALQNLGAKVIEFPCITIEQLPPRDFIPILKRIKQLDNAIFLSANAVHALMPYWPQTLTPRFFAIGPATAQALKTYTIQHPTVPKHYSSEGLLELPELSRTSGVNTLIISGTKSKTLLKNKLQQQGHHITTLECYRPQCADKYSIPNVFNIKKPNLIISTSPLNFKYFIALLNPPPTWLKECPLLVTSTTMTQDAHHANWKAPIITSNRADDQTIIKTILSHKNELLNN